MRYVKFNTQQEAQDVCDRVFTAANNDGVFAPGTTAYATPEHEEYFTVPVLDGFDSYFTNRELSGAEAFKEEKQGRLIIDDLIDALKSQSLSDADTITLMNKLHLVITLLIVGRLRSAKGLANNIATDAIYTAARKTWLVDRIQVEINKL